MTMNIFCTFSKFNKANDGYHHNTQKLCICENVLNSSSPLHTPDVNSSEYHWKIVRILTMILVMGRHQIFVATKIDLEFYIMLSIISHSEIVHFWSVTLPLGITHFLRQV